MECIITLKILTVRKIKVVLALKFPEIPGAFADCLGGLLSVCAQNLELTLTTSSGATISQVLTQYQQLLKPTVLHFFKILPYSYRSAQYLLEICTVKRYQIVIFLPLTPVDTRPSLFSSHSGM